MTKNIKNIELMNGKEIEEKFQAKMSIKDNNIKRVVICFNFPCTWTIFTIEELKEIIRLWIKGEKEQYPFLKSKDFNGPFLFKNEIEKIFNEV